MTAEHALEVQTLFRGVVIGTKYVLVPLRHRPVRSRRHARRCSFAIGSSAHADAPVAPAFLRHLAADPRGVTHPLIEPAPFDADAPYAITLAPGMTGTIYDGARTQALRTTPDGVTPGPRVALARHAHARLDCGAVTFLVAPAEPAAALPATPFSLRAIENRYHLGTALGMALLLLLMLMIPSDPHALSLDILSSDRGLVKYLIKPPVEPPPPEIAANGGAQASGGAPASQAAKGPPGAAGSEKSRDHNRRLAVKGDSTQIRVARAPEPIDPRDAGVLGIFKRSSAMRSMLESETLGSASADVLGNLTTGPVGDAYGHGGLDSLGTGGGGSGTGEGTIGGAGHLNTIGFGTPGGEGTGLYGGGVGRLGTRRPVGPSIIPGIIEVRGTLDREIVRRIIRRHINEVRFCYEQELVTHRNLGGRLVVQFSIAPSGQVLASVMQSSTLGNARVENCAVKAVRRWEFPKLDGGLTSVSYPFVFAPAGLGAD